MGQKLQCGLPQTTEPHASEKWDMIGQDLISSAFPLPTKGHAVMHGLDRGSNPTLPQRAAYGPGLVPPQAILFPHVHGARADIPMFTVTNDSSLDDIWC